MSFPAYDSYRDSGVEWLGDVPSHWQITKVKRACSYTTGWTPPTGRDEYYGDDYPWANISDLGPRVLTSTAKGVTQKAVDDAKASISPRGSLLFSFKLSVGLVSFAGRDLYTNEAIASFLPGGDCDPKFGYYALPLYLLQNASENIYGAKLLNQQLIGEALLCLPPEPEQRAIAAFLDRETAKIDALVEEQRRLIDLLKEMRQAVISHAVTKGLDPTAPMKDSGIEWLGEVPAHWQVRSIASCSSKITNGYVGPTREILLDAGVRYLQSLHIKNGEIIFDPPYFVGSHWSEAHAKSILQLGDVLIVQTGDVGQTAVVTPEFVGCNCHALIIVTPVLDVLSGPWLELLLRSDFGQQSLASVQTGALHPHLEVAPEIRTVG